MTVDEILKNEFCEYKFLKVTNELFRGNTLFDVTIMYPHTIKLQDDVKEKITKTIANNFLEKDVKVVFKKSFLDDISLSGVVYDFIKKDYFVMLEMFKLCNLKIDENLATISFDLVCDDTVKDYVEKNSVVENLLESLKRNYHYEFKIQARFDNLDSDEEQEQEIFEIEDQSYFKPREIDISNVERLLGDPIKSKPMYIKDINSEKLAICVCGTVKEFSELLTKEKKDEKGKVHPPKPYFRWKLEDFTGTISVLTFCSETNLPKIRKLADGSKIVMVGDAVPDGFSKGFMFRPKQISFCELPENFEEVINYRKVPEHYKVVNIQPAHVINQMDLFNYAGRVYPEYIKTHAIVVYDFETSGLSSAQDFVIEIGALKIINGEYTEQFQTFVHLDKPLPPEITELTTITDNDLKDAPLAGDVFADFYKFCDGCVLCGYNSDNFDLNFLKRYWKQYNYEFKHETLDVYKLATKVVHGLKKYTLSSIADHLKIQLFNAHRALADATATAEVLLTIANEVF